MLNESIFELPEKIRKNCDTLKVYLNRVLLKENKDYTCSGSTIKFRKNNAK